MHIEHASEGNSEEILSFLETSFSENALKSQCTNLRERLSEGSYHSLVVLEGERLIGHFGISLVDGVAIFNMMGVAPEFRGKGLARRLLDTAIRYSVDRGDISHLFGYCVLQHSYSERIHDESFVPVGLIPDGAPPVIEKDPLSRSKGFGGNLVLCKPLTSRVIESRIGNSRFAKKIEDICSKIGVEISSSNSPPPEGSEIRKRKYMEVNLNEKTTELLLRKIGEEYYTFLGLLPSVNSGFLNFGFLRRGDYGRFKGRLLNKEREQFVGGVLLDLKNGES